MPGSPLLLFRLILLTVAGALVSGCAAARSKAPGATTAPAQAEAPLDPATAKARLSLDQIEPAPKLIATTKPTSKPTTRRAPLEAVELYAQAVDALKTNRRFTAINQLEKALKLDPDSFELNYTLGKAYVVGRADDELSVAALERAASIDPDHLELQTALGRQYLTRGNQEKCLEHLRLAVQTSEYKSDATGSAEADLFLGRALQQNGYDRAALEQYARLLKRVESPRSLRNDPRLAFLITDRLYVDIGDLYARNGQLAEALQAFEPAARRDPADFDLEARVVRAMVGLRRFDDASRRAADAVVRFRANQPSLDLLREVHRASGKPGGAADELARMLRKRPNDSTVLFALVELFAKDGQWDDAERILADRWAKSQGDFSVLRRRVTLRLERDDVDGAARLIIESLAKWPDLSGELNRLWASVADPIRPNHLKLAQVQSLDVPPAQAAAKEVAIAAVADEAHRDAVADQAITHAVKITPPYAPAFRERLARIWQNRMLSDAEKSKASDELIASTTKSAPILAQELTGLAFVYRKQPKPAVDALAKAVESGGKSPSLLASYAVALRSVGETAKFEQLMWKLLSDHPAFETGYSVLYGYYAETTGADAQADRVLNQWLLGAPYSVTARVLQAARHYRAGRSDAARDLISKLLDEQGDDEDVLRTAFTLYTRSTQTDALIALVEKNVREHPANLGGILLLSEIYASKKRPPSDVIPMIDAARKALAEDPDALYRVAALYARVGQRDTNEAVLREVLHVDPTHPPASNDLGYTLADRGAELPQAESLIRQAVNAEPDNPSVLDSLGWVLYKRGKFAEAKPPLEKAAAGDAAQVDPVVLDHLGDVLYRLGEKEAAGKSWDQALAKLKPESNEGADAAREETKELRANLDNKSKQLKANQPVTVSPVVEQPRQAQNVPATPTTVDQGQRTKD
jgi:tetratricopeptide (TPR) repeat protein